MKLSMSHALTIVGMVLTVCLSGGASYVGNTVATSVNQTKIEQLVEYSRKNSLVHNKIYTLESEVNHTQEYILTYNSRFDKLEGRLNSIEKSDARKTQALESLINATNELTKTTNKLAIAVAKLEE